MFSGYILVGGKSSRMKTNKAQLKLAKKTLSEHAVSSLSQLASNQIKFVTNEENQAETNQLLSLHIPRISDEFPERAALGGIYTALADSQSKWTIILACDYPFVTEDLIAQLAEVAKKAEETISAVVPIQPEGFIQPLCAFYRTSVCLKTARELINQKEIQSARRLAEEVKTQWVSFKELKQLKNSKNFFLNINTKEDYLKAKKIFDKYS